MKPRIRIRSLRTKLVLAFFALGFIPMTTIATVAFFSARASLIHEAELAMSVTSSELLDKLDRTLSEASGDIIVFGNSAKGTMNPAELGRLANVYMHQFNRYQVMIIADASGKIVAVTTQNHDGKPTNAAQLIGRSVKGLDWFEKSVSGAVRQGQAYYTDAELDPMVAEAVGGTGQTLAFSTPIVDEAGRIVGVWSNKLSLQSLVTQLTESETKLGERLGRADIDLTLLSKTGLVLDDSDQTKVMHMNLKDEGLTAAKLLSEGQSGVTVEKDLRTGVLQVGGYTASKGTAEFAGMGWGLLARENYSDAIAPAVALRNKVIVLEVIAVALVIGFAWWLGGTISAPITKTVTLIGNVADTGDLTQRLNVASQDEIGVLADSFNGLLEKLGTIVVGMRQSGETVTTASRELASVADTLSGAAQSQAASLEETAASMEELTATVKQNADSAGHANQLASKAREVADKGGQVVGEAVTAMSEISQSSRKIEEIITTIDEIAFQTNLLALNAAVEAARAGAQGRGFAVVAAEVRNLAARSADAAKEIKGLIRESSRKVEHGTGLVNQSGVALEEIVNSVKRVTDIVGEIAAASSEQRVGIEEVGRAVSQMDSVTQQNAAQTEELSATAASLADQSRELERLLKWFQLEEGHEAPSRSVSRADNRPAAAKPSPRKRAANAPATAAVARPTSSRLAGLRSMNGNGNGNGKHAAYDTTFDATMTAVADNDDEFIEF